MKKKAKKVLKPVKKVAAKSVVVAKKAPPKPKVKTFMDRVIAGEDLASKIDDFIDEWSFSKDPQMEPVLHNYLGMTSAEYRKFITNPASLPEIVEKRRARGN